MNTRLDGLAARAMLAAIRFYRRHVSALLPPACRYEPSCSGYAEEAVETHGSLRGAWLALTRVARCNPWGGHGWDPVPPSGLDADADAGTATDRSQAGSAGAGRAGSGP